MSSQGKIFYFNIYNDSYNENNDIYEMVPDEFLKYEELPLEDKLKSGKIMAYDEKKYYILSREEEIKKILGKQTKTELENSERNNINNGIQEKKELKEEDNKTIK